MKWNALETDSISLRIHLSIRQEFYKQIEFVLMWNSSNDINNSILDDLIDYEEEIR